ncbi:MAG TPA: sensor domain-containing diguanylate cyclase [Solirubrobacteraceae bacterium]|nr:sensor domain-containing diguanylate cyclase [Solirubrobacteraceae bacterium]
MSGRIGALRAGAGRVAPFAGACVLAWSAELVGSSIVWWQYAASVLIALLAGFLALVTSHSRRHGWLAVVPSALLLLVAIGILRNSAGGINSGAGALAILPVFQTALYSRSRRDLFLVLVGLALFFVVPVLITGPPAYPHTQYRAALLAVAVDGIIGLATQRLVARVRHQASESRSRESMLEQVGGVVHSLFDSSQPRIDVCESARTISNASAALLYEPTMESDQLVCTACAGIEVPAAKLTVDRRSAAYEAFRSGRPRLITQNVEAHIGLIELWIASGRPASLLYQPLLHGNTRLGVLVIGWPNQLRAEGPRATVAALLAHEVAAVIARADAMDDLAGEAQTDGLTGLPNRRAWDDHLARIASDSEQWAIAVLDLDHFKEFNDTYGHPAGDRLLKETAAAWRDQLRTGDFLARIGGEEFGLLLPDCELETAAEVIDRLCRNVTHRRTCSAGLTTHQSGENAETAIARADQALYQAKGKGRNRVHVAEPSSSASSSPELP